MRHFFIIITLLLAFSLNASAAVFGKLEVQCPDKTFKVYVDDKLAGSGTVVAKVRPGNHKIKVLEKGKMVLKTVKFVGANKYVAVKAVPAKAKPPKVTVQVTPESITISVSPEIIPTVEVTELITSEAAPALISEEAAQKSTEISEGGANDFNIHFYVEPGTRLEDQYGNGCFWMGLGTEFGWDKSLLFDVSINSIAGESKKAVISEGSLYVTSVDIGIVYKLSGFYFGTGAGSYILNHEVSDKILREKKALNLQYSETIDGNVGFYCKGGYRFPAFANVEIDIGVKAAIINTIARSTEKDTITLIETENELSYGLPITAVYLGIVF